MKCIAIRSSGRESSQDYTVRYFDEGRGKTVFQDTLPFLDEASPSLAVKGFAGTWQVLAMSLTSSRFDRTETRNIKNSILWECEDQKSARGLAAALLSEWDAAGKAVDICITASSDPAESGWHADVDKLGDVGTSLAAKARSTETSITMGPRLERPYAQNGKGPGSSEWKELARELVETALPGGDGFRVCVTGWPSEPALGRLRRECTRLLHKGTTSERRLDETPRPAEPTPPKPQPPPPDPLRWIADVLQWVQQNPGKSVGIALVLAVLIFSSGQKKKRIERLEFAELGKGGIVFGVTFDRLSTNDMRESPRVQAPEKWHVEDKGWNSKARSWSANLKPSDSDRDGKFDIQFPFAVKTTRPELSQPIAWKVQANWGERGILKLDIHLPKSEAAPTAAEQKAGGVAAP